MSYQCDRCLHYTANNQKHECVMDELEELRKDHMRLNWMIENSATVVYWASTNQFIVCSNEFKFQPRNSPREAIDEAMENS